jgi:hypothetical protein
MAGNHLGDAAFFFEMKHLAIGVGDIFHTGGQAGTAMVASQQTLFAKFIDIPPNGLRGYAEMLGQRLDGHEPLTLDPFQDLLLSLV